MKISNATTKKIVVGTFISVPILSSFISTYHLISLFNLGNQIFLSILLAIAFELGAIAAFLVPTILPNIKKSMVYTIFIILAIMQIIGNVFFSYDFVYEKLKIDPTWLDSFLAFSSNFGYFEATQIYLWLAILIGVPIPLIALFFLKSWIDYLKIGNDNNIEIIESLEEKPLAISKVQLKKEEKEEKEEIEIKPSFLDLKINNASVEEPVVEEPVVEEPVVEEPVVEEPVVEEPVVEEPVVEGKELYQEENYEVSPAILQNNNLK